MSEKIIKENEILLETSLQAFFFDQLSEVNRKYSSPLPQEAIYYSSLVMDHFGEAQNYFECDEDGRVREKVLGIKLLEAGQLRKINQKKTLKDVGDTALFLCGYFADSLNKKIVDLSYYHDLGQLAYKRLDTFMPNAYEVPEFFKLISSRFSGLTELISIVSQKYRARGPEDTSVLFVANSHFIKAS